MCFSKHLIEITIVIQSLTVKMGCSQSSAKTNTDGIPKKKNSNKPKIPIRLFYIPGSVKDAFLQCISPRLESANPNSPDANLNLRFIDAHIQRESRRHWVQDSSDNQNVACSLFLADIRDHPTTLLTIRAINWFIKSTIKNGMIKIIVIYDNKQQLEEMVSLIPSNAELFTMNIKNPESLDAFCSYIKTIEQQYSEKRTNWTTTRL